MLSLTVIVVRNGIVNPGLILNEVLCVSVQTNALGERYLFYSQFGENSRADSSLALLRQLVYEKKKT